MERVSVVHLIHVMHYVSGNDVILSKLTLVYSEPIYVSIVELRSVTVIGCGGQVTTQAACKSQVT